MDTYLEIAHTKNRRAVERRRYKSGRKRSHMAVGWGDTNPGFICKHCGAHVSPERIFSGVGHRNHCPYCLWSRHVDLHQAGDRLCACKGDMQPVGLTLKAERKKYGDGTGELMLVHLCVTCEALSINRIAADDLPDMLLTVYQDSLAARKPLRDHLKAAGIRGLMHDDENIVRLRLFGENYI